MAILVLVLLSCFTHSRHLLRLTALACTCRAASFLCGLVPESLLSVFVAAVTAAKDFATLVTCAWQLVVFFNFGLDRNFDSRRVTVRQGESSIAG
jgi:hypothetical protein